MSQPRPQTSREVLSAEGMELDLWMRTLRGPADVVRLEPRPFIILRELMRWPGKVVTKETLIERLWPDPDLAPDDAWRSLWNHVLRARKAMKLVGVSGDLLQLVFETGYCLAAVDKRAIRALSQDVAAA